MHRWGGVVAFFWAIACAILPAHAERRLALVVGNAQYEAFPPLNNPVNDSKLMETTLVALGFEVKRVPNANLAVLDAEIKQFSARINEAGPDSVALFYYSGHGAQLDGRNYLIPVNSRAKTQQELLREALNMGFVEEWMRNGGAQVNFIILDACRDNRLPSSTRSGGSGLAMPGRAKGFLYAFATAPGETALDGTAGNSPYTLALARALATPGLAAELAFKEVASSVSRGGLGQNPFYESGLVGANFCFAGCSAATADAASQAREKWDITQLNPMVARAAKTARDAERQANAKASDARTAAKKAEDAAARARDGATGTRLQTGYLGDYYGLYEGEFSAQDRSRSESRNGFGILTLTGDESVASRYRGQWLNNKLSGVGIFEYAINKNNDDKKLRYEGDFFDGNFKGFGVTTWRNKKTHAGAYEESRPNGPGVYVYPDGRKYEGEFKIKPHGIGVLWNADGSLGQVGRWKDGELEELITK